MRAIQYVWLACVLSAVLCGVVSADVIIDLTYVGNPGNAADDTGHGSVGYSYYMGTYEVTVGQYTEFLNAKAKSDPYGLYNPNMGSLPWGGPFITRSGTDGDYTYTAVSGKEDQPVRLVSFFDAMRFANWMENGQGSADTEDGSYDLSLGTYAVRQPGASWVIPTEDEWYKAAYYSASNSLYYEYPNGTDAVPAEPTDETTPRVFNFGDVPYWHGIQTSFTSRAETTGYSPYGTYDQGGNVEEWTETFSTPDFRILRGGHLFSGQGPLSASSFGSSRQPQVEGDIFGFRLVFVIPEPRTILLLLGALPVLLWLKRS